MAIGRVGYFASGSVPFGVNDIYKTATTDNFVFVLSDLKNTIKAISDIAESNEVGSEAKSVAVGIGYTKEKALGGVTTNNGVFNGSSVPSKLTTVDLNPGNAGVDVGTTAKDILDNEYVYKQLKIKCQSAIIPGLTNTAFDVNIHGFNQKFRGKREYGRSMSISYLEDVKFRTSSVFRAWSELMVGTFTGMGYADKYKVTGILYLFSSNPINRKDTVTDTSRNSAVNSKKIDKGPVSAYGFVNVFPTSVEELPISGDNSGAAKINVTFAYDIFVPGNTAGEFNFASEFRYPKADGSKGWGIKDSEYKSTDNNGNNRRLNLLNT